MGTDVTYNGVKLKNVITRQWEQEPAYDASGTDLMFFRHKMRFEGIVHAQGDWDTTPAGVALEDGPKGTTAVDTYRSIAERLGRPRGTLEVTMYAGEVNGRKTLYKCGPTTDESRDVDNGPKTRDLSIMAVAGDQVFKVAFTIECASVDCESQGKGTFSVLSNRWSISETMDDNFYVTRTIAGRIRYSEAVASMEDDFKRLVVPGLENGFRRERVEFAVDPTGLEAAYQVVDRQTHTSPPWPATKIAGTCTESCGEQGIEWYSDVHLRLDGHPGSDRKLLITRAVQVMEARMEYYKEAGKAAETDKAIILEGASITEYLGDANAVELHVRLRRTLQETNLNVWLGNLRTKTMGNPLKLDDLNNHEYWVQKSPLPENYGYYTQCGDVARKATAYFLLQCFLQQPCSGDDEHAIGKSGGSAGTSRELSYPTPTEVSPSEIKDRLDNNLSDDARKTVYTVGVAESVYHVNAMRVQLPLAGDANDTAADTSFVAVLSGGQCQREIRYEAEKVGEMPEIPKPVSTYTRDGLKGTLLKHRIRFHPPTLLSGGRDICFRVHAYYLYAMNRPPTESDVLATVSLPTQKFDKTQYPMNLSAVYNEGIGP